MTDDVLPVVKGLYLCDELLGDPARKKTHLIGLLNAVRVPAGAVLPFKLGRLIVFALIAGGIRPARLRVQIVTATGRVVYRSPEVTIAFPQRRTPIEVAFRILGLVFPEPGEYLVELWCDDRFVEDRLLQLLAAEETDA